MNGNRREFQIPKRKSVNKGIKYLNIHGVYVQCTFKLSWRFLDSDPTFFYIEADTDSKFT